MKTTAKTAKKNDPSLLKSHNEPSGNMPEEEVAVIVDVQTKAEYYMFVVDSFKIDKRTYTVMIPYEPDRVRSRDAEVVILRSQIAKNGDQLYVSIRDKKELESAFEIFYKRFEESSET